MILKIHRSEGHFVCKERSWLNSWNFIYCIPDICQNIEGSNIIFFQWSHTRKANGGARPVDPDRQGQNPTHGPVQLEEEKVEIAIRLWRPSLPLHCRRIEQAEAKVMIESAEPFGKIRTLKNMKLYFFESLYKLLFSTWTTCHFFNIVRHLARCYLTKISSSLRQLRISL